MYLNIVQLAESFGVAESVVEGWIRDEKLPCVRDRGRLMFDRGQVVQWAAERGLVAKAGFLAPNIGGASAPGRLEKWLRRGGIWREVAPARVREVIGGAVATLPDVSPAVQQMLAQNVQTRGGITWAPVGAGLALPHLRSHAALGRDCGVLALLFLTAGAEMDGDEPPDGVPVTRLFFFMAPSPRAHLELLAQLSGALTRGTLRPAVLGTAQDDEILTAIAASEPGTPQRRVSA